MTYYCFWECKKIGAVFLVDSVEVVERCPFHVNDEPETDEDTGYPYPNHFEDSHLRRVFSEALIKR